MDQHDTAETAEIARRRRRRCPRRRRGDGHAARPARASTSSSSTAPTCPSDTLSTHAISRGGVVQLARWGLLDEVLASGAPPIRTVSFHFPGGELVSRRSRTAAGVDHLVAPRRHILDEHPARRRRGGGRIGADRRVASPGPSPTRTGASPASPSASRDGGTPGDPRRASSSAPTVSAPAIARAVGARVIEAAAARRHRPVRLRRRARRRRLRVPHRATSAFAGVFPTHDGEANVWVCTPAGEPRPSRRRPQRRLPRPARADLAVAGRARASAARSPRRSAARPGCPTTCCRPQARAGRSSATPATTATRSPGTGSPTRSETRSCSRVPLGEALRGEVAERERDGRATPPSATRALAPIFDVTWRLSQFPPVDEFVELQKRLSALIEPRRSGSPSCPRPRARRSAAA